MFEQEQPFKFNFSSEVDLSENFPHVECQSDQCAIMPAEELILSAQVIPIFPVPHTYYVLPGAHVGLILLYLLGSVFSNWHTCRKLEMEGVPVELVQLPSDVMF